MNKIILAILFILLALIIFKNPTGLGIQDWDLHYAYAQTNNISLLDYRQIPLWNPYHCGGMTQIGNVQNSFWTPFFIPILIFGPVLGYKVQFLLYILAGFLSIFVLGRYFRISKSGSILLSLVYVLSGIFFAPYATGMPGFLPLMLLPLVFLFVLKSVNSLNYFKPAIIAGILISLIFLSWFHYIIQLILFVVAVITIKAVSLKKFYPFKIFLSILISFIFFSAVKLLPALEMVKRYPRLISEEFSGYSLVTFTKSLLWPVQDFITFNLWGTENRNFVNGISYNIDENSLYIGFLPLFLLLLGLVKKVKKHPDLIVLLTLFLWLTFGYNIFPSFYKILHQFPLFKFLRVAQRYRYYLMIPLVIFIGFGFDIFYKVILGKFLRNFNRQKFFASITIFLIGLDLLMFNYRLTRKLFNFPSPITTSTAQFKQRLGMEYYDGDGFQKEKTLLTSFSDEFPYLVNGWGTINCYESQPLQISANNSDDYSYRGEFYLLNGNGEIKQQSWSPNKIILNTALSKPDFVIINQNYDPGWNVKINGKKNSVIDKNGLIGVYLPEGKYKLNFFYLPNSFIIGSILSIFSVLIILIYLSSSLLGNYRNDEMSKMSR